MYYNNMETSFFNRVKEGTIDIKKDSPLDEHQFYLEETVLFETSDPKVDPLNEEFKKL